MFRYAMIAVVGVLSAVTTAKAVVAIDANRRAPAAEAAHISRAADGHYWATGRMDGRSVRLLVDTGATAVSLTQDDARRLGLDPHALRYDAEVITAEGHARAAPVKLARLSVDGVTVADVDALVIEKGLQTSLLGMSYLGRLSRFEASPTALVLQP